MKRKYKFMIVFGIIFLMIVISLLILSQFCGTSKPLPLTWNELRKITKKAKGGDGRACWCLALYYSDEDEKYRQWLERSVESGDPYGQYSMYSYLIARHPDREREAIDLLTKSAEQNYPHAQNILGDHYRDGRNVKRNLGSAEYWYRKASLNGDVFAMLELSKLLVQGQADKKKLSEAYEWTVIANHRSDPQSQLALDLKKQQAIIFEKMSERGYDKKAFIDGLDMLTTNRNITIPVLIKPYNNILQCEKLAR